MTKPKKAARKPKVLYAHGAVRPVELKIITRPRNPIWRYQLEIGPTVSGEFAHSSFYGEENIRALMNFCRRTISEIKKDQERLKNERSRKSK